MPSRDSILAHAIPLTLIARLGHLTLGHVDLHLVLDLHAGAPKM